MSVTNEDLLDAIHKQYQDFAATVEGSPQNLVTENKHLSLIEKIKDNIAYILGLPATIGGAFGFLWDSGNDQAELAYQVTQLETAVADLKAENDLLGGAKNFSLDLSGAPGGSLIPILIGVVLVVGIGTLFWYQARRRR